MQPGFDMLWVWVQAVLSVMGLGSSTTTLHSPSLEMQKSRCTSRSLEDLPWRGTEMPPMDFENDSFVDAGVESAE